MPGVPFWMIESSFQFQPGVQISKAGAKFMQPGVQHLNIEVKGATLGRITHVDRCRFIVLFETMDNVLFAPIN